MSTDRSPLFLEKRAYYQRRLADAARLMPVLGIGLFMFPLFWILPQSDPAATPETAPMRTVSVMLYLFLVWAWLAGLSGLISRRLGRDEQGPPAASAPSAATSDPPD
ncbi:MAG: hypothetical protein AAGA28_02025 [Pseudomonadota bacterium]